MPAIDHAPMHLQTSAGQPLTIALESTPGAGVVWQLPAAPAGCSLRDGGSVPGGAGIGGSAIQHFVLTCDQPGERRLRFQLKRPWESEVRAVQAVVVKIS